MYEWGNNTYDTKPRQTEKSFTLSFQRGNGSEDQLVASSSRMFSTSQTSGGFPAGKSKFQLHGEGWYMHFFTSPLICGGSKYLLI